MNPILFLMLVWALVLFVGIPLLTYAACRALLSQL